MAAPRRPLLTEAGQLAVDVAAMSVPHEGCDEIGVNPVGPAFITQAQVLAGLCPKSVE
jgi:hypothetical protein